MADETRVEFENMAEVLAKLDSTLYAEPLRDFFKRAAITVQGEARSRVMERWHDTGQTANSIMYEVDDGTPPQQALIGFLNASEGSPLWFKARAGEYGTGRVGDPAVSHGGGHWPPGDALQTWAGRHGFASGYQVAAAIGRRGGILPRRSLRDALAGGMAAIEALVDKFMAGVASKWGQG
jgi:hypothetical protein